VDYSNKKAELVFVTVFNTHMCKKKLITLVYSAKSLTDFSYTNFTVSYSDALDRLRVHLNIILMSINQSNNLLVN